MSGAFCAVAMFAGMALAVHRAEVEGLDAMEAFGAGVAGLAGGLVGGTLIAGHWPASVSVNPFSWAALALAPKGVLGVLLGGALASLAWLRLRGLALLRYADAFTPAVALAYALARVGCFVEGHCFGTPTTLPWAVRYGPATAAFEHQVDAGWIDAGAAQSLPIHPTQLYLAAVGLAVFALARKPNASAPGRRFALAACAYGAARFAIEFLRGDSQAMAGPLDSTQLLALAMACCAAWLWHSLRASPPRGEPAATQPHGMPAAH